MPRRLRRWVFYWDAVREGMEDFEELAMLQDAH